MKQRLRINPTLCNGAGFCAEILPERIHLDPWGYPVIADDPIEDEKTRKLAAKAVRMCPRHALVLQDLEENEQK